MSYELIGIVSVGLAVAGFLWSLHRDIAGLHRDIGALRKDVARDIAELREDVARDIAGLHREVGELRERMARLEGLLEGFVQRPAEAATA